MKMLQPNLDILFITGDFVAHFTNNERGDPYDPAKYATVMGVHSNLTKMVQKHFSNSLVIPTFGNNDFDLDDEPANETSKFVLYSRIYKLWFEDHPVNSKFMNLTDVKRTFMNGGYYRVDINPNLTVMALNTVMYLFKNEGIEF